MKTAIATALSVVGVLGAGSAAALVNTQILDGGPSESTASAAVLPPASTVDVSIPEIVLETMQPDPALASMEDDSGLDTTTTTAPAAPAPSGYLTAFNVGEAGVVTVDVVDGQILLVSAEPKPGWEATTAEGSADDNEVEVEFTSETVRVEFEATFVDGQIVPKVTSKSIGGSTAPAGVVAATPPAAAPAPAAAPPVASSHHDDDDKYEAEHDDDHEDHEERDDD
jgi:hypothetical protein